MSDITWIKLRTNMFDDEKIRLIERLPEGDSILVVWIKLLAHAGKSNCNGYIMISENIPMNIDEVAAIFNRPFEKVKYAISVLQRYNMIEVNEEDIICITNWQKHQNIEGMDKIRVQNRERKRLERERKKTLLLNSSEHEECHVTVTGRHATDIDKELELDKDIKDNVQQVVPDVKKDERKEIHNHIINYLNEKSGKRFTSIPSNTKFINARLDEGYKIEDFIYVIDLKTKQWLNTEADKYLRPSTLFNGEKMQSYVNEKEIIKQKNNRYNPYAALESEIEAYKREVLNNDDRRTTIAIPENVDTLF